MESRGGGRRGVSGGCCLLQGRLCPPSAPSGAEVAGRSLCHIWGTSRVGCRVLCCRCKGGLGGVGEERLCCRCAPDVSASSGERSPSRAAADACCSPRASGSPPTSPAAWHREANAAGAVGLGRVAKKPPTFRQPERAQMGIPAAGKAAAEGASPA